MNNNGNVCGEACGWCGACSGGTPTNAICRACGNDYWRTQEDTSYWCDQCLANAHARAERTVEQREPPKVKAEKPRQCVGLTPEEVVR